MRIRLLVVLALISLIVACKSASPRLTNSHAGTFKVIKDFTDIKKAIDVYASIVPIEPAKKKKEKKKTFFDLRDSIPHTYISALADKIQVGKAAELVELLKLPLSDLEEESERPMRTDYATQKVKFVIGNIKNYHLLASEKNPEFAHPNTRLTTLNTTLDFTNTDFHILSIDKLESEFEYIDLGTLNRTQEANFTSKLTGQYGKTNSITDVTGDVSSSETNLSTSGSSEENVYDEDGNLLGAIKVGETNSSRTNNSNNSSNTKTNGINAGVNGEIGFNNKESIAEALAVKLKRLKTGFIFDKNSITITQHGTNLIDVSDNVIITAKIYPNDVFHDEIFSFINLFDKSSPQSVEKVTFKSREIKYFDCNRKNANVTLKANGMLRAVENKFRGDNILEFDDKVIYYPFEGITNTNTTQIDQWSDCLNLFELRHEGGKETFILYIKRNDEKQIPLRFMASEAQKFFVWFNMILKDPKIENLKSDDLELFFEEIQSRESKSSPQKIKIVDKDLKADELKNIKDLQVRLKKVIKTNLDK